MVVNYQNGKVYAIRSPYTDKVYVGSTTQTLCKRMADHKVKYRRHMNGKYHYTSSYEIIALGDSYIELLELCPCGCKAELHKVEGKYIRELDCVNQRIAGSNRTKWTKEHCDKIAKKKKIYYEKKKAYFNAINI